MENQCHTLSEKEARQWDKAYGDHKRKVESVQELVLNQESQPYRSSMREISRETDQDNYRQVSIFGNNWKL